MMMMMMMMMRELESGGVLSASSQSSRLFRARSRNTNWKGQNTKRIYPFSMWDHRAFVFDSTFVSHPSRDEENTLSLSLQKRGRKKRRLSKTHRPVARVNQPRRFVRVDFRLLFPVMIDDIIRRRRSRRGIMVALLHDDDVCLRALSLSLSLSLS